MRPNGVVPWDAAIATELHGARDAAALAAYQHLGRRWAAALVHGTGIGEAELAVHVGRSTVALAKLLDEYMYLIASRRTPQASPSRRFLSA